ncbi:sensor histidine kinase [Erythrobacter insulae]|uniref:sensor histidine kinase n=1 Tax=Erythrobacter insulae TaxID=2584124 RepID=UPI002D7810E5|nr:PAS domain-containing protein [Erythrobacter insulae]
MLASFNPDTLQGDEELARIARFAAHLCDAPAASVSLVDEAHQRFIASKGMSEACTPRSTSFCATTMLGDDLLEVLDANEDTRFREYALVTGTEHLRYYVGAPLISSEGAPLGALCVTDIIPRDKPLGAVQKEGLKVLAEAVMRRIEAHREANRTGTEIELSAQRIQFVLDSVPDIAWSAAAGGRFDYFNARWEKTTGLPPPRDVEEWRQVIHPDDYDASLRKFTEAVKTAELFEDEWRMKRADGTYRWVLSRAVPSTHDPETARWYGTLTDIDDAYRISQERELLAGELAHRIKNIFSVIIGLITLHSNNDPAHKAFGAMLADNIRALSRAQEFALQMGKPSEENLIDLLTILMAPYGTEGNSAVSISGDDVPTGRRSATPLALTFHELATNSAKYGALSVAGGKLSITIKRTSDAVAISWQETGGPETAAPENTGFGSRLIKMSIEQQMGGTIKQAWRSEGLQVEITLPLERLAQ